MRYSINKSWLLVSLVVTIITVGGCGGGGGGSFAAGGGIGGTGIGTITGFGSVIINDTRTFDINDDTKIFLDGEEISESVLMQNGPGFVAQFIVDDSVSQDFTSGQAVTIRADNLVKGPVTNIDPLKVLEQTVVVTSDTLLVDVPLNDIGSVGLGGILEVSGYADANNIIQATRIQFKAGGSLEWKLTGPVNTVVLNASFKIGDQSVELNGVVPRDCDDGLQVGDLVEVKASDIPGFVAGDPLDSVLDVECETPGLEIPGGVTTGVLEAEIEGLVTALSCTGGDFEVNGQCVAIKPLIEFEGGDVGDIVLGVKLEAEGSLDVATGILSADEIEFRENRVRIEAPLAPGDVVGNTITIMSIPVLATSLSEDEDNILGGGLSTESQVEIKGFVDSGGQVLATEMKITRPGDPRLDDVRLRGPVDNILSPTFEILGVTVDVSTATSIDDERVEPPVPLNMLQFFDALTAGALLVEVNGGTYNAAQNLITNGEIEIED